MCGNIYKKSFKSNPDILPDIEDYVMEILSQTKMSDENINKLGLAVAEAAANSILHGNNADENKNVDLTITINDKMVKLVFRDYGQGFDPNDVPNPTIPENILKTHGRGIHIMNTFLDKLTYNFLPDGTETILEIAIN